MALELDIRDVAQVAVIECITRAVEADSSITPTQVANGIMAGMMNAMLTLTIHVGASPADFAWELRRMASDLEEQIQAKARAEIEAKVGPVTQEDLDNSDALTQQVHDALDNLEGLPLKDPES